MLSMYICTYSNTMEPAGDMHQLSDSCSVDTGTRQSASDVWAVLQPPTSGPSLSVTLCRPVSGLVPSLLRTTSGLPAMYVCMYILYVPRPTPCPPSYAGTCLNLSHPQFSSPASSTKPGTREDRAPASDFSGSGHERKCRRGKQADCLSGARVFSKYKRSALTRRF